MIQVHGKTILSMEFKSMAIHSSKAQFSLAISKAQFSLTTSNPNSYWQYQIPILIGNNKAQFLLATSKLNFHWHYFIKKKKAQDYQRLAKKKYHVKMLPWQKKNHVNHLMKKLIESYLENYVLVL